MSAVNIRGGTLMQRKRLLILVFIIVLLLAGSAAAVWRVAQELNLGLDLRGGVYVLYRAVETEDGADDADKLARAVTIIRSRVDALGVAEPNIQQEGQDRIRVELPGIEDQRAAREVIGKTALLKFVGPDDEVIVSGDELKDAFVGYDQYNRLAVSLSLMKPAGKVCSRPRKSFWAGKLPSILTKS